MIRVPASPPQLRRASTGRSRCRAVTAVLVCAGLTGPFLPASPAVAGPAPGVVNVASLSKDEVRNQQWQLDWLDAREISRYADGAGVTVAVLDSGVDADHPDLVGQVLPGIDLVDGSTDGRTDPVGHGTAVAALIAGLDTDNRGVVGLAPKAKILPVRVLDNNNRYQDATTVAEGLRWAVDHDARVVNMSLGGIGYSKALAEALDYAFDRDVVVVACTGNLTPEGSTQVWYPAREPGVLAVTGLARTEEDEPLWASSVTGPQTVLSAPAADLLSARPGGYWRVQGTSFAAPLVSATAALVRSNWPQMPGANVVNRLITTARDLGAAGRDDEYGFGAVDPVSALTAEVPEVARNPLDTNDRHGVTGFGAAADFETPDPVTPGTGEPTSWVDGSEAESPGEPVNDRNAPADGASEPDTTPSPENI